MEKSCSNKGDQITLGPWGHETGNEWSYCPKHAGGIKQIIIKCSDIIHSLMFKADSGGDCSVRFGGEGGNIKIKINIDFPSEFLTGISGSFCKLSKIICSLKFHSNEKHYGPFGTEIGTAFSVDAKDGMISGFHGRCGQYLEAIGVYLMPVSSLPVEPKMVQLSEISSSGDGDGPDSYKIMARCGDGGREWDDGVFSAVEWVHVIVSEETGVVSAIKFGYLKSGSTFVSTYHGNCLLLPPSLARGYVSFCQFLARFSTLLDDEF